MIEKEYRSRQVIEDPVLSSIKLRISIKLAQNALLINGLECNCEILDWYKVKQSDRHDLRFKKTVTFGVWVHSCRFVEIVFQKNSR
jgi:hypothetical protein